MVDFRRRDALRTNIRAALATRERSAAAQLLGALLEGVTLDALDKEIIESLRPDPPQPDTAEREAEALLLVKRGNAPGLGLLFEQIPEEIDGSWTEIAKDLLELAALEIGDDLAKVAVMYTPDALPIDDRMGRLARVAIALRKGDTDFVREEASRFLATLQDRTTDTASLALEVSISRRDPIVIAALERALGRGAPHRGTMKALLHIIADDPAFESVRALAKAAR